MLNELTFQYKKRKEKSLQMMVHKWITLFVEESPPKTSLNVLTLCDT